MSVLYLLKGRRRGYSFPTRLPASTITSIFALMMLKANLAITKLCKKTKKIDWNPEVLI